MKSLFTFGCQFGVRHLTMPVQAVKTAFLEPSGGFERTDELRRFSVLRPIADIKGRGVISPERSPTRVIICQVVGWMQCLSETLKHLRMRVARNINFIGQGDEVKQKAKRRLIRNDEESSLNSYLGVRGAHSELSSL